MAAAAATAAAAAALEWPGLLESERALAKRLLDGVHSGAVRAPQAWQQLTRDVLRPEHPFELHQALHSATFARWDDRVLGPAPVWLPSPADVAGSNALGFMERFRGDLSFNAGRTGRPAHDWELLQRASVRNPEAFWSAWLAEIGLQFDAPPDRILRPGPPNDPDACEWLPGARLNIAAAAISSPRAPAGAPAVLWAAEGRPRDVKAVSRGELAARARRVASAIAARFQPGTAIAIVMPMTLDAVVIYLGIVLAGCAVVSVADSFSGPEIAARLRISAAAAVFTQDAVIRGGRALPLYERVAPAAGGAAVIVLPALGSEASGGTSEATAEEMALRPGDETWARFINGRGGAAAEAAAFKPRVCAAGDVTNILFSSGTTGEPKAIPWTHVTPLRCAADAWAHQDVRPGTVVCWPTNLGWMMGPWLTYAALLNGGTIALYQGAPLGRDFGDFVEASGVEVLGLVPSIVKAWRASGCMAGADWRRLRCFSSTGEASAPEDYHWLAARVLGYRPVIEYCGGTEIGGGFLSGSLLQPQAPSAFSTPTLGASIVLLGPDGEQSPHGGGGPFVGELALAPPLLGSSQLLLNRDHAATYFGGMPPDRATGVTLRRHGDEVARLAGGYYRALGRVDDTMNLGGIKVASVELERAIVERLGGGGGSGDGGGGFAVLEAAAVGVPAPGGGPERLHVFLVLKPGASGGSGGGAGAAAGGEDAPPELHSAVAAAVRQGLNPLFKVERTLVVAALPRTASNKVMRRVLRDRVAPPPVAKL